MIQKLVVFIQVNNLHVCAEFGSDPGSDLDLGGPECYLYRICGKVTTVTDLLSIGLCFLSASLVLGLCTNLPRQFLVFANVLGNKYKSDPDSDPL